MIIAIFVLKKIEAIIMPNNANAVKIDKDADK